MGVNMKKLTELPLLSQPSGEEYVIVNANGAAKQIPMSEFGSGTVASVNGVMPDENGNIEIETVASWNDLEDKPFGEEVTETLFDGAVTVNDVGSLGHGMIQSPIDIVIGDNYIVELDGTTYDLVGFDDDGTPSIGVPRNEIGEELPFMIYPGVDDSGNFVGEIFHEIAGEHVLKIQHETHTKLDEKYMPSAKMEMVNPVGAGSFSMNRNADGGIGGFSHAEGGWCTASGNYSHAEGYSTIASGDSSHAEGGSTIASGARSHAEGGCCTANGNYSHAEGSYCTASGDYSHVEGDSCIAGGNSSHVQGRWNEEDAADKYAHIVGNGTNRCRSNAHTLDWDGNAWFAGGIELTSPNGTRYRFTVSDDGTLSAVAV